MLRRTATILVTAHLLGFFPILGGGTPAAVAAAPVPRRIIVIAVEGTTIDGWQTTPALAALLQEGSDGLIVTRAGRIERDPERARLAAFATLGAGARSDSGVQGLALAQTLDANRVPLRVSRGLEPVIGGAPVRAVDGLRSPPPVVVIVIEARSLQEAAETATLARAVLGPDDRLIVASVLAPPSRIADRAFLGVAGMEGGSVTPGLLSSPTTRREGIVALQDIAPTILDLLGIIPPARMSGRPFEFHPRAQAVPGLVRLDHRLVAAARVRTVLIRMLLVAAMVLFGGIATGIAFGRLRARAACLFASSATTVLAALPLAIFMQPLLPGRSSLAAAAAGAGIVALAIGIGARASLGTERGIAALAGITALAVLVDVLFGGPIAERSPLSYLIVFGARFYGIGNELMGLVIGAAIVAVSFILGRPRAGRNELGVCAALLAIAVVVMAAPTAGAKFGAALTAVPAFGILAARAGGRRLDLRVATGIAAATGLTAAAVYAADRARAVAQRTHIATGGSRSVFARKLTAAKALFAFSIWTDGLIVFAAAVIVLIWRRKLRMPLAMRPQLGAALQAGAAGIVAAVLFNDAGVIAAAMIAIMLGSALMAALLEPAEPERPVGLWVVRSPPVVPLDGG